jgi:anti-anti-sigma factor
MTTDQPFERDDSRHASELAAVEAFSVDVDVAAGRPTVVQPRGDLDMLTAPVLRQRVDDALAEHGSLVIDLSGVTFVDSAGLRALLLARDAGPVELRDPSTVVRQTFEIARMASVLGEGPPPASPDAEPDADAGA